MSDDPGGELGEVRQNSSYITASNCMLAFFMSTLRVWDAAVVTVTGPPCTWLVSFTRHCRISGF